MVGFECPHHLIVFPLNLYSYNAKLPFIGSYQLAKFQDEKPKNNHYGVSKEPSKCNKWVTTPIMLQPVYSWKSKYFS